MSVVDTLVTNRTQADEARTEQLATKGWAAMTADEREEWLAGPKGAYNVTDLNRVGEAIRYVAAHLIQYGYAAPVSARTDWTMADIPSPDEMRCYIDDVSTIRAAMAIPSTTPAVPPDMDGLTPEEANDIERILAAVERTINSVAAAFRRSGQFTFWSGTPPLPANEPDLGRTWEKLDAMETTWANWQVADWYLLLYGNLKAEGEVTDGV